MDIFMINLNFLFIVYLKHIYYYLLVRLKNFGLFVWQICITLSLFVC